MELPRHAEKAWRAQLSVQLIFARLLSAEEAERIIAALAERNDPQERNYFEFKFFTGLRSSETIALRWANVDFARAEMLISEAIVRGRAKGTKANVARVVKLNSRALAVLQRQ